MWRGGGKSGGKWWDGENVEEESGGVEEGWKEGLYQQGK